MKIFLVILSALFVHSSVFASVDASADKTCQSRLGAIVNNRFKPAPINQSTYTLAQKALHHYRAHLTKGGVYISSAVVYKNAGTQSIAGYGIDITDGGDESTVAYYFDARGKLIYGTWHNQSPENYWFCEK